MMKRGVKPIFSFTLGLITTWIASSSLYFMGAELWLATVGIFIIASALSALSLEGLIHDSSTSIPRDPELDSNEH